MWIRCHVPGLLTKRFCELFLFRNDVENCKPVKYLIDAGYRADKIVIYGKDRTCFLAAKAALRIQIRGIVLENASDDFFDEIRKDIEKETCRVLILNGRESDVSDWHNGLKLYEALLKNNDKRVDYDVHLSLFRGPHLGNIIDNLSAQDVYNFFPTTNDTLHLTTKPEF
jgi:pimeloyl-ACP methyl ester carboxylesterase